MQNLKFVMCETVSGQSLFIVKMILIFIKKQFKKAQHFFDGSIFLLDRASVGKSESKNSSRFVLVANPRRS